MLQRRSLMGLAALATLPGTTGLAAEMPEGPVRFIIPFPPGGPGDVAGRILAPPLSQRLGRPVVMDNRSGAGGMVGIEAVARATPDGRTIGFATAGAIAIAPQLVPGTTFTPLRDLAMLSRIGSVPQLIVVNPRMPIRTLPELLEHARREPGRLTVASSGNGSIPHLAIELLLTQAGVQLTHVPYRGVAPALTDLISGQVNAMIADLVAFVSHVRGGTLRGIALAARERSPLLPEVPTTAEGGLADFEVSNWYGLVTAAATPEPVQALLQQAMVGVLREPDVVRALGELGATVAGSSQAEFRAFVQSETTRWTDVARRAGARMD